MNTIQEQEDKIDELQTRVVEGSTNAADKQEETGFYKKRVEEMKIELEDYRKGDTVLAKEVDSLKRKCKTLRDRELELMDQLEILKGQVSLEKDTRAMDHLANRTTGKQQVPPKDKPKEEGKTDKENTAGNK